MWKCPLTDHKPEHEGHLLEKHECDCKFCDTVYVCNYFGVRFDAAGIEVE
jgi:hypothetical protein